jgi:hypothetical protein
MEDLSYESWATIGERTQSSEQITVTQGFLSYIGCVNTFLVEDRKFFRSQTIVLNPLPLVVLLVFNSIEHLLTIVLKVYVVDMIY